jgi:hypothetical protein
MAPRESRLGFGRFVAAIHRGGWGWGWCGGGTTSVASGRPVEPEGRQRKEKYMTEIEAGEEDDREGFHACPIMLPGDLPFYLSKWLMTFPPAPLLEWPAMVCCWRA